MKLGLGLGIGVIRPTSGGGGTPFYDTSNMTIDDNSASNNHHTINSGTSFTLRRFSGSSRAELTLELPAPGNYRITGTLAAYDGPLSVDGLNMQIVNGSTSGSPQVLQLNVAGAFDEPSINFSSGFVRFKSNINRRGYRLDDLFMEAV